MNRLMCRLIGIILAGIWIIILFILWKPSFLSRQTKLFVNDVEERKYLIQAGDKANDQHKYDKKAKILCWILTQPKNLKTRATAIKATWGKRCDKLLFFSSVENKTFPVIGLDLPDGRATLPNKTAKAFKYCYQNYGEEFDWFMKADDDTYVIVENLRKFVSNLSASDPIYFGHNFFRYFKQGYMSGGAGYVLSREALNVFVTRGLSPNTPCKLHPVSNEDVLVGSCLERLNVKAIDTVDEKQRERFLPLDPLDYLINGYPFWLPQFTKFKPKMGKDCCAEDLISLHYVRASVMYLYDMLIYHVKVTDYR